MSRVAEKAKTVIEMIQELTKEELVELISWNWWIAANFSERQVKTAKARVLRKKANAAFEQYENTKIPELPKGATLEQYLEWLKQHEAKESHYRRYEKLWKKADKIEYGR